jgi:hypothetical protein
VLESGQQHATNTLRPVPYSRLYEIRGLETAKASRGDPRPCLWGEHRARQESEPRARPPQALSLRLVPSSVNGPRPRLNRLSEGLIGKARPEKRQKPRIAPGPRLWAVPYTRLIPGQIPLSTQAFIMLHLEPASTHADATMAEVPRSLDRNHAAGFHARRRFGTHLASRAYL